MTLITKFVNEDVSTMIKRERRLQRSHKEKELKCPNNPTWTEPIKMRNYKATDFAEMNRVDFLTEPNL
jgi:hypothetical protein